jgi:hypothetical protein
MPSPASGVSSRGYDHSLLGMTPDFKNLPLRSRPTCAYPRSVVAESDRKLNPSWDPSKDPVERARASLPRKAASSSVGTEVPLPRGSAGPVACHVTWRLTIAGTELVPPNWKLSRTARSRTLRVARRASASPQRSSRRSWITQNRPDGRTPPL